MSHCGVRVPPKSRRVHLDALGEEHPHRTSGASPISGGVARALSRLVAPVTVSALEEEEAFSIPPFSLIIASGHLFCTLHLRTFFALFAQQCRTRKTAHGTRNNHIISYNPSGTNPSTALLQLNSELFSFYFSFLFFWLVEAVALSI